IQPWPPVYPVLPAIGCFRTHRPLPFRHLSPPTHSLFPPPNSALPVEYGRNRYCLLRKTKTAPRPVEDSLPEEATPEYQPLSREGVGCTEQRQQLPTTGWPFRGSPAAAGTESHSAARSGSSRKRYKVRRSKTPDTGGT